MFGLVSTHYWILLYVSLLLSVYSTNSRVVSAVEIAKDVENAVKEPLDGIVARAIIQRAAPQAIVPPTIPTAGSAVTGSSGEEVEEPIKSTTDNGQPSSTATTTTGDQSTTSTATPPPATAAPAAGGGGGTCQEDQWIKVAGIIVPAVVAIGLGVAGYAVTIHVNSPRRDRRRDEDDEEEECSSTTS